MVHGLATTARLLVPEPEAREWSQRARRRFSGGQGFRPLVCHLEDQHIEVVMEKRTDRNATLQRAQRSVVAQPFRLFPAELFGHLA